MSRSGAEARPPSRYGDSTFLANRPRRRGRVQLSLSMHASLRTVARIPSPILRTLGPERALGPERRRAAGLLRALSRLLAWRGPARSGLLCLRTAAGRRLLPARLLLPSVRRGRGALRSLGYDDAHLLRVAGLGRSRPRVLPRRTADVDVALDQESDVLIVQLFVIRARIDLDIRPHRGAQNGKLVD